MDFFKSIIPRYLKDVDVELYSPHSDQLNIVINQKNKVLEMTIAPSLTNWKTVKRRIDEILKIQRPECLICENFTSHENNAMTSCNKCGNSYCAYCFMDIMQTNKGLIVCPFCRYTFGKVCPPKIIDAGKKEILKKLDIKTRFWLKNSLDSDSFK